MLVAVYISLLWAHGQYVDKVLEFELDLAFCLSPWKPEICVATSQGISTHYFDMAFEKLF